MFHVVCVFRNNYPTQLAISIPHPQKKSPTDGAVGTESLLRQISNYSSLSSVGSSNFVKPAFTRILNHEKHFLMSDK